MICEHANRAAVLILHGRRGKHREMLCKFQRCASFSLYSRIGVFGTIPHFFGVDLTKSETVPKKQSWQAQTQKTRDCPKKTKNQSLGVLGRARAQDGFLSFLGQSRFCWGSGLARIFFWDSLAFWEADPKKVWNCPKKQSWQAQAATRILRQKNTNSEHH